MRLPTASAALCAVALTLTACGPAASNDPLAVDPVGAARAAESAPDLIIVADALSARAGTELAPGLTLVDARAEGDVLVMDFVDDRTVAAFGPTEREVFAMKFSSDTRSQLCGSPATRTFVESRGGVRASILSSDGVTLASETITSCA